MFRFHTEATLWERPLKKWTLEETVAGIIELQDQSRIDASGGYPSDYIINGSILYQATLDYNEKPRLIAQDIEEFIEENGMWLEWIEEEIKAYEVPASKVGSKNERNSTI